MKNSKKISIILILLISNFILFAQDNCRTHDKLLISFNIDSFKTFEFEQNKIDNYVLSPFYTQDKIWSGTYEIDLKLGKFTKLSELYGNAFKKQINQSTVWKDRFTGDIYVGFNHEMLLRYKKEKSSFDTLKIKNTLCFLDLKDKILFGTHHGLYILDRKKNKTIFEDKLPIDLLITSIDNYNADTVIINNVFLYNTLNRTVQKKSNIQGSNVKDRSQDYSFQVRKKLPIGQSFTICRSEDCVWFYRENDLFYTKDNNLFYSFIKFPQGYIRQFDQDSSYVYVLFDEKLVIFNKNYIFKNSILFEYEEHNQLVKMYFEESRIINDSIQNIEKFINSVKLLKKNEDYNKYEDLCAMINNLPSQLEYAIYNDNVLNTINLLENGTIEGEYRFFILKGLCKYYLTIADISNSLNFFKKIKQEFPDITDRCIDYSYESALKYDHALDSLYALNLTPDSLIFRQAHLRMKLIESSCWFGESWYRLNIVEDKYKELLVKFPNSKLADNAELWLLEYQFYGDEGGLPHESISHFKDFKKKYPDSDVLSNVALNIFHAYMNSDSENPDTIIFNYDCAIHELENALPSLKNDTLKYKMILSTLRELQNGKIRKIFKIELTSEKVKYLKGEDIIITTKIINLLSKSQKIKLYKNSSMLTFSINNENVKDCFIPSATSDENMIEHTLSREKPIIQKIVLNKDARNWDKGRIGIFELIKPGIYYIRAIADNLNLDSNQIRIIVE